MKPYVCKRCGGTEYYETILSATGQHRRCCKACHTKRSDSARGCLRCGIFFYPPLYARPTATYCSHRCAGMRSGGRSLTKNGYVTIYTLTGRAYEHRLAMEQTLGRKLAPNETVHHLNGVRDDNRPENLELWRKAQPAGVRASDATKFHYEDLVGFAEAFA